MTSQRPVTMSDVRLVAGEGKLTAQATLQAVNAVLRMRRRYDRKVAAAIADIIWDELGGVIVTDRKYAEATSDRIVRALENELPHPATPAEQPKDSDK